MRGHEYIYDLRKKHKLKPLCIMVNDFACQDWVGHKDHQGVTPNVVIEGEPIETLDMRFVRGCVVSASSPSESRAKALYARLKMFKPSLMVVAHHVSHQAYPGYVKDCWIGIWKDEQNV